MLNALRGRFELYKLKFHWYAHNTHRIDAVWMPNNFLQFFDIVHRLCLGR